MELLPDPLRPTKTTYSPGLIFRSTRCSAASLRAGIHELDLVEFNPVFHIHQFLGVRHIGNSDRLVKNLANTLPASRGFDE